MSNDLKYEEYIPEDFMYYWDSKEEFQAWAYNISKEWTKFEEKGYSNINLAFDVHTYHEYGENYSDVYVEWTYQRPYTQEELDQIEKDRKKRHKEQELYLLQMDCAKYLRTNSKFEEDVIKSMCQNVGVLELFKEGKLKL